MDFQTGLEINRLKGHLSDVTSVAFRPDGRTIEFGRNDDTIKLWNTLTGEEIMTLKGHTDNIFCVVFSPDSKIIASGSVDNLIKFWDSTTGKEVRTLLGHSERVSSLSFSPKIKLIESGSFDKKIKLWDAKNGKEVKTLNGHIDCVWSVDFSPSGQRIISVGRDEKVKLWQVESGEEISSHKLNNWICNATISFDGKSLLVGTYFFWLKHCIDEKGKYYFPYKIYYQKSLVEQSKNNSFATFFLSQENIQTTKEENPARVTQKVVNIKGQWAVNFVLTNSKVSLLFNGVAFSVGRKDLSSVQRRQDEIHEIHEIQLSNIIILKEGSNYLQWKLTPPNEESFYSEIKYTYYDDVTQPNLYLCAFVVESLDLKFSSNDAEYVKALFQKQMGVLFKQVFATAFTADQTNTATIKKTMERIGSDDRIRKQDVVLISFSSHGTPSADDSFIIQASEYDPLTPNCTTIRFKQDVVAFLNQRPSKRVLLLDACFSGSGRKGNPNVSKTLADNPAGWVLISSSTGTKYSYEHQNWQHGSITYALMQAIEMDKADLNNNRQITLNELYSFLRIQVPAQNRVQNLPEQHPTIKKEEVDDFVIYILEK